MYKFTLMSLIEKKIAHYTFIKNLYINGHFIKNLKKKID